VPGAARGRRGRSLRARSRAGVRSGESARPRCAGVYTRRVAFLVFNTLTKRKEAFAPREPGVVRMYNCGPTVYNRQHIGNFRTFLFADTLRRWLEYLGLEVRQVMNITDVGHLTDDERGEGEDKIEVQARRERKDPWQISREYTRQFLDDIAELGLLE